MAAIITRGANHISVVCETEEEANVWFEHLRIILNEMYPDDVTYNEGEIDVEGEST